MVNRISETKRQSFTPKRLSHDVYEGIYESSGCSLNILVNDHLLSLEINTITNTRQRQIEMVQLLQNIHDVKDAELLEYVMCLKECVVRKE